MCSLVPSRKFSHLTCGLASCYLRACLGLLAGLPRVTCGLASGYLRVCLGLLASFSRVGREFLFVERTRGKGKEGRYTEGRGESPQVSARAVSPSVLRPSGVVVRAFSAGWAGGGAVRGFAASRFLPPPVPSPSRPLSFPPRERAGVRVLRPARPLVSFLPFPPLPFPSPLSFPLQM